MMTRHRIGLAFFAAGMSTATLTLALATGHTMIALPFLIFGVFLFWIGWRAL